MSLDLLKKFCELKSVEATAKYFGISIDDFFVQLCKEVKANQNKLTPPKLNLVAFIDGASSNNPGKAGIGIVFMQNGKVIETISEYIGEKTNNEAEYIALLRALEIAQSLKAKSIQIFSDSELVVKQIKREYAIRQEHLKKLYQKALSLISKFESFEITHVERSLNTQADRLAKSAIERY